MVYTERAETAAVSFGTMKWGQRILKNALQKKLFTHIELPASAVRLLESGEQRCIKATNKDGYSLRAQELCESRGGRPGLPSLINLRFLWT